MTRTSFDKTAFLYNFVEKHIWEDYSTACSLINEFLSLNQHEIIIDVGGGTGLIAKFLRKMTQESDIVVIDLARSMLKKVDDSTLSIIQGDITSFPLKNETFTLAVMINTIHHIDKGKQKLALKEVFRILKKQGRVLIIDIWFPNTFSSNLFIKLEKILVGKTFHLPPDVMKRLIQDVGFQDIDAFQSKKNPARYIILAKK